jgi:hypothetical protein
MISAKALFHAVEKFADDNAPLILTAVGVTGTISSVVLATKASLKASKMIEQKKVDNWRMDPEAGAEVKGIDTKDKVLLVWKEYLPTAGTLTVAVAAIVFANRINTKRAAAMAAAYSLSERAYGEYREKVVDKFNANKERQVRDEIAQDHVNAHPPKDSQIIVVANGNVTCYDQPSDRYFHSSVEKIRSAQNEINVTINEVGEASLEEFYAALGLQPTTMSEDIGWTRDKLLDVHFSSVIAKDNTPCLVMNYDCRPLRNAAGFRGGCSDNPPF